MPFRVYYNFFGTLSFPIRSTLKQGRWVSRVQFTFYLSTAEINIYSRVWFTQSLLAIPGGLIGSVGASVCVGTKTSGWNNLWPKSFAWWFMKCSWRGWCDLEWELSSIFWRRRKHLFFRHLFHFELFHACRRLCCVCLWVIQIAGTMDGQNDGCWECGNDAAGWATGEMLIRHAASHRSTQQPGAWPGETPLIGKRWTDGKQTDIHVQRNKQTHT